MNLLRKMQASFAWDWGLAAPSMGIWKKVDLDVYDSILIRSITYQLTESKSNDSSTEADIWTLNVFVHVETGLESAVFNGAMAVELV